MCDISNFFICPTDNDVALTFPQLNRKQAPHFFPAVPFYIQLSENALCLVSAGSKANIITWNKTMTIRINRKVYRENTGVQAPVKSY